DARARHAKSARPMEHRYEALAPNVAGLVPRIRVSAFRPFIAHRWRRPWPFLARVGPGFFSRPTRSDRVIHKVPAPRPLWDSCEFAEIQPPRGDTQMTTARDTTRSTVSFRQRQSKPVSEVSLRGHARPIGRRPDLPCRAGHRSKKTPRFFDLRPSNSFFSHFWGGPRANNRASKPAARVLRTWHAASRIRPRHAFIPGYCAGFFLRQGRIRLRILGYVHKKNP